jgi:hypothetical protein
VEELGLGLHLEQGEMFGNQKWITFSLEEVIYFRINPLVTRHGRDRGGVAMHEWVSNGLWTLVFGRQIQFGPPVNTLSWLSWLGNIQAEK